MGSASQSTTCPWCQRRRCRAGAICDWCYSDAEGLPLHHYRKTKYAAKCVRLAYHATVESTGTGIVQQESPWIENAVKVLEQTP
jgi:hypothetical protein